MICSAINLDSRQFRPPVGASNDRRGDSRAGARQPTASPARCPGRLPAAVATVPRAQTRHKPRQAPRMACPAEVRAPGPTCAAHPSPSAVRRRGGDIKRAPTWAGQGVTPAEGQMACCPPLCAWTAGFRKKSDQNGSTGRPPSAWGVVSTPLCQRSWPTGATLAAPGLQSSPQRRKFEGTHEALICQSIIHH